MKNPIIGGFFLVSVIFMWVGSSTTIQIILDTYPKPYFLTYITTSLFSFYLLTLLWRRDEIKKKLSPNLFHTAIFAFKFCPLWFFANYFFNVSLGKTSIASNTILTSTSGIFTLIFSIVFLKSTSSVFKWLAVLISFSGVVCIGLSEPDSGKDSLIGDIFAILGACLYAMYSVCLKSLGKFDTMLMFGCVGAINSLILIPGIGFLHMTGIETFEFPQEMEVTLIVFNALIGSMLCDLFWAWSVDYLTPTICTLGLSLTIPLSMIIDSQLKGTQYAGKYVAGATMIVLGFVMISIGDSEFKPEDEKDSEPFIHEI